MVRLFKIFYGFFFILMLMMAGHVLAQDYSVFIYNDHGKRDPFMKLVNKSGNLIRSDDDLTVKDILLEGIMVENDGNNIAIINGKIVKVNDKLGAYVIKKVDVTSVTLEKGTEIFVLNLKKED